MTTKEALHRLVDRLPESELAAAHRLLEYLHAGGDPVLRAFLAAPEDDEAETPEEATAVREARERVRSGEVTSHEDLARELGW